jgi:hypothetical protein
MSIRRIAALLLIVAPVALYAQRGGGGGGGGSVRGEPKAKWDEINKEGAGGLKLSNGDLEDISPIKLLIGKRKDLKLTDVQFKQFKDLETASQVKNEPLFKALDSLRKDMKPPAKPSDDDRARMLNARNGVMTTVGSIRANYDATLVEATVLLDESQKKTAAELIDKQSKDAADMLKDKLGAPGGRGGT